MKMMKSIVLIGLFTTSAYATNTVMTKTVTSSSARSCQQANARLSNKIESLSELPSKIKVSECKVKHIVRNNYRYTQSAELQFEVNDVLGNY